ncbi:MAG: agmatinase [Candidatus Bathyarchaeota archaeon]|nr:agmatinase [Candidatus Bathyarchaeota archaeon]
MPLKPSHITFLDKPSDPSEGFVLFAAPLDATTSNRSGTRFGPDAIRRESAFLDTYSARTGLDWDDLELSDIGDVDCSTVEACLSGVEDTIKETTGFPVMLGGEHTITLGAIRALRPELVVVFDAHLDLRDELFDERLCHATYLRRAIEETGCNVLVVGVRALSGEEVEFAEEDDHVSYIPAQKCIREPNSVVKHIAKTVHGAGSVYLSIDLDVLDPAYAPAVGNPHPEGVSVTCLMDMVDAVMGGNVVGLDLNEVYPHYDQGNTATTAAYVVMESLYSMLRHRDE